MLYILEGGIGRDEQFSEKVKERGMVRVIQDYDSNEDALEAQMTAMIEAMLVAMLKNWTNTMGMYDYRNVLDSLEGFLDTCSEMGGSQ